MLLVLCVSRHRQHLLQTVRPHRQWQPPMDLDLQQWARQEQNPHGSAAWVWRWCGPLGPEPRRSLPALACLCPGPSGLWTEQQASVLHWRPGGRGPVCGVHRAVESKSGSGVHDTAGTQFGRVPGSVILHQIPQKVGERKHIYGLMRDSAVYFILNRQGNMRHYSSSLMSFCWPEVAWCSLKATE